MIRRYSWASLVVISYASIFLIQHLFICWEVWIIVGKLFLPNVLGNQPETKMRNLCFKENYSDSAWESDSRHWKVMKKLKLSFREKPDCRCFEELCCFQCLGLPSARKWFFPHSSPGAETSHEYNILKFRTSLTQFNSSKSKLLLRSSHGVTKYNV